MQNFWYDLSKKVYITKTSCLTRCAQKWLDYSKLFQAISTLCFLCMLHAFVNTEISRPLTFSGVVKNCDTFKRCILKTSSRAILQISSALGDKACAYFNHIWEKSSFALIAFHGNIGGKNVLEEWRRQLKSWEVSWSIPSHSLTPVKLILQIKREDIIACLSTSPKSQQSAVS